MDTFLQHAQQLLDVARTDSSGENSEFALLIRHDGGIHIIMESETTLDAVAAGAKTAYRVSRSAVGVRVIGMEGSRRCRLEDKTGRTPRPFELLRDQPLYRIASPVLSSAS